MNSWKGKQNYLGTYCLLRRVKIRQRRNLRKSDSFWIDFICCQSHQKPSITHSLIWWFVWRDGGRTQWVFIPFEHPLTHEERCCREWTTQWHRCVIKRTESQLCWRIHRQQVDCQIDILRWFLIRLNQLNSSRHGKGKIPLDVSETSSRLKVRRSCVSIEMKMGEYLRFWH